MRGRIFVPTMNTETDSTTTSARPSLFRNWISLAGVVVAIGALFSFVLDALAAFSNPYIGILTYCVVPAFLISGIVLTGFGIWRERRKRQRDNLSVPRIQIDLSRPRDRRVLAAFAAGSLLFI